PLLPGINTEGDESWDVGVLDHSRLHLSLFARERLFTRREAPSTQKTNDPEPPGPHMLALIPEEVTICAAALNEICMDEEIPPWTPKQVSRIWRMVRTGQMTSAAVTWYGRRRSMNEFDALDGWMNAAPLDVVISRWVKVRHAHDRERKAKAMQK